MGTSARKSGEPTLSGKTGRTEPRRKRLLKPFLASPRCLKKQQHRAFYKVVAGRNQGVLSDAAVVSL